jgi:hypothetical protein
MIEQIFTEIYNKNGWNGEESLSGKGSGTYNTQWLRPKLVELINSLKIDSILDAACGDFFWMSSIIDNLNIKKYHGVDVVKSMIDELSNKYAENVKVTFSKANIIEDDLPKSDLIIARDCLVHLSFDSVKKAINNFIKSGSTYLLTTTFIEKNNIDIPDGSWRPINFVLQPFNFPHPDFIIDEECKQEGTVWNDKSLGLWKMSTIKEAL